MDGMLSQEEINALLSGIDSSVPDENAVADQNTLTAMEKDTIGEVSNISMGTAATTLSSLVSQKVDITTPSVSLSTWQILSDSYERPCVFLKISYKEGIYGDNILILQERDVKIITDLMMGGDGSNIEGEINDLHLSAISEAMNQMMGSASTSMSSMLGFKIDITPPAASLVDLNEDVDRDDFEHFSTNEFVKVSFRMTIGTLVDSEIMQLYPIEFCRDLAAKFLGPSDEPAEAEVKPQNTDTVQSGQSSSVQNTAPDMSMGQSMGQSIGHLPGQMSGMSMQEQQSMQNMSGMSGQQMPYPQMMYQPGMMPGQGIPGMMSGMPQGMPYMGNVYAGQPDINVQSAQFQTFLPDIVAANQRENINLIKDVPLDVTVELGRTSKSIQDILDFAPGTIVELNKIAGEPVDVLVNGKLVARGEVVVIEESFGVKVTEIIK